MLDLPMTIVRDSASTRGLLLQIKLVGKPMVLEKPEGYTIVPALFRRVVGLILIR
jgi:hypothetical protein